MKKAFVLMMLLAFLIPLQSQAQITFILPDGARCTHKYDMPNSFGGWAGRYECTANTAAAETYWGWGPALSDPPANIEAP
ncbi:MAG: hypothetical protein AAGM22_16760 [Acidobacteriota bacterium]